ncbi:Zn-ribbon domain-containing OB-fold protein [Tropicimonas sp. IMCC34011]|uniref:Zn-ribbon domain-containing OB-fold protein n=1 Tax=Tropicimonas sp. IMCC34011 TaxID=2248759 RepID=UPI000E27BF2E|nr:zinc ribbon domain-containing protein [Tropicimonas sp. IMCC34011]
MTDQLPPNRRSPAARALTAPAAEGRFVLQHCNVCGTVQYPPQEFCTGCLSLDLGWKDTSRDGQLVAEAEIHHSLEPAFGPDLPMRTGLVRHESGVTLVAFLDDTCRVGAGVRLELALDRGGAAIVKASVR